MGAEEAEHLAASYQMFKDLDMPQGQERTAKALAALGYDSKGKAAKHEGAAEARKAHAEQVTERAEPGKTGTADEAAKQREAEDAKTEPRPEAKPDARHTPPAGRTSTPRQHGKG